MLKLSRLSGRLGPSRKPPRGLTALGSPLQPSGACPTSAPARGPRGPDTCADEHLQALAHPTWPPAVPHPPPCSPPPSPLGRPPAPSRRQSLAGLVPLILGGTGQLPLPAHMAMGGRPKKPALRAGLKEGSPGLRPFGAGGGASRGREVVGRGLESRSPSVGSHESDLRVTAPHLFNPHH